MKKKSMIKWAIIAVIAIGLLLLINLKNAPVVQTETVKKGNMKELVELQGKVELDNREKVYVRLSGIVAETKAEEGDRVDNRMALLKLDVEDLNYAIEKAEAAYAAARAGTESLKKSIKPQQIKLAEAQLEQAKAAYKAALEDYEHKKKDRDKVNALYQVNAVPQQEVSDTALMLASAESSLKNAEQAVNMAQYNLDILNEGVSKEDIHAAEASQEAARIQLAELRNSKGKASVYSPISGIVLSKSVEKGEAVQPGALLYEIGDYDSAYIRVDVLVDDISKIRLRQKAIVSGDVIDNREIMGEIYYIAPKAESKVSSLGVEQQRIEARIKLDDASLLLKPGYTLDVDIVATEKPDALFLSDKAVFEMDKKDCVFVVINRKLELREIQTGIENDDFVEVLSGLSAGETVVIDPDSKLKPGHRIKTE